MGKSAGGLLDLANVRDLLETLLRSSGWEVLGRADVYRIK